MFMNNQNVYSLSKSDVPRYVVIDHSVLLEEIVTETIGRLLDVDWNSSTVLGNSTGALSFRHKFELIQEKIGGGKEQTKEKKTLVNKFLLFSTIRNKFAHVRQIDKWEDFFKKYEKDGNALKGWYAHLDNDENNNEDSFRLLYYYLTHELFYYMIQKNIDWAVESGKLQGENRIREELFNFVTQKASESPEVSQLWIEFTEQLQKKENSITSS